jgi:hypothetical protein
VVGWKNRAGTGADDREAAAERIAAFGLARDHVRAMLADADPQVRAYRLPDADPQVRAYRLPDADEVDGDGQVWFGDIRVDPTGSGGCRPDVVTQRGSVSPVLARISALELLAAAEFAD